MIRLIIAKGFVFFAAGEHHMIHERIDLEIHAILDHLFYFKQTNLSDHLYKLLA